MDISKKPKVVMIIGNGFDLNIGRKTSYKDFWLSDHCPKDYPAPLIQHLNSRWEGNLETVRWFDLENELLAYYDMYSIGGIQDLVTGPEQAFLRLYIKTENSHINDYDDAMKEQVYSLQNKGLLQLDTTWHSYIKCEYAEELVLSHEERDRKAYDLIKKGLCEYIIEASQADIDKDSIAYIVYKELCESEAHNNIASLTVHNFNYTPLPRILESTTVYNTHGKCEEGKIILGTKDYSKYDKEYDFFQKSFDPNFNPPSIVYDLLEADDIIIFGHSLGVNDSQYFKPFFQQQASIDKPKSKRITIFTKDEKGVCDVKRSIQVMTDYDLSLLSTLNRLDYIKTESINDDFSTFKSFLDRYGIDTSYYEFAFGK